jgi:hypothetical protein
VHSHFRYKNSYSIERVLIEYVPTALYRAVVVVSPVNARASSSGTSSTIPTFSHNEQVRFRFIAVKLLLLRPVSILQLVSDCISHSTFRVLCKKVSLVTVMCPTAVYSWGLAIYQR